MEAGDSEKMKRFEAVCAALQAIVGRDIGGRGMAALQVPGDLARAALAFGRASGVVVLTGFPCRIDAPVHTETDGPSGAAAIAYASLRLGKPTALVTDDCNAAVLRACGDALRLGAVGAGAYEAVAFPPKGEAWSVPSEDPTSAAARLAALIARYDHTVSIERAGASFDGSFRTMRGRVMDHLVAPLDPLLTLGCACGGAGDAAPRTSTGIGDGGNEAGMGKVIDAVRAHIPKGAEIGCVTPADNLIAAGVSNWGGWGLVAAVEAAARLGLLLLPEVETVAAAGAAAAAVGAPRPLFTAAVAATPFSVGSSLLPTDEEESALAAAMAATGAGDGISGQVEPPGSVDGMQAPVHLALLAELRGVLASHLA